MNGPAPGQLQGRIHVLGREPTGYRSSPHASPVLHAIEFLTGQLDEKWLTTLRQFGGLQSYPSRSKDPVPADDSTGSVGTWATAPIWGALSRRYVRSHFGTGGTGRQYSLVGDAELDEGACWEAIFDPMVSELGEVVWIVDYNRQSLDRVVPTFGATRLEVIFAAAGWQVITVKYGALLQEIFARRWWRGPSRSHRHDDQPRISAAAAAQSDRTAPVAAGDGSDAATIEALIEPLGDDHLLTAIRNLGGHDLDAEQCVRRD